MRFRNSKIIFRILENGEFQCPNCEKLFTRIVKHIGNKNCKVSQSNIDMKEFQKEVRMFIEGMRGPLRDIAEVFKGLVKAFTRA